MITGGGNVHDWSVQGRLEGCIGALLLSLLPPLLYAVTNLGLPSHMQHVWSLLLLTSAPLLMLTTLQVSLHSSSCMHLLTCPMSCICHQRTAWLIPSRLRLSLMCQLTQSLRATVRVFASSDAPSKSQIANQIQLDIPTGYYAWWFASNRAHAVQGGLWWLTSHAGHHKAALRLVQVLALAGSLVGLEGRVLLPTFGHYLGLHYPWNYMAISAALFGGGSLMLLHFEGAAPSRTGCVV